MSLQLARFNAEDGRSGIGDGGYNLFYSGHNFRVSGAHSGDLRFSYFDLGSRIIWELVGTASREGVGSSQLAGGIGAGTCSWSMVGGSP